jgi:segregation and condensation protein B
MAEHDVEEAVEEVEEFVDEEPVESLGRDESRRALHALLFVSDRPVSADRLAAALGDADTDIIVTLLEELGEELEKQSAPYRLREIAGGYQLTTEAEFAPFIKRMLQIKKSNRLSKAVVEGRARNTRDRGLQTTDDPLGGRGGARGERVPRL